MNKGKAIKRLLSRLIIIQLAILLSVQSNAESSLKYSCASLLLSSLSYESTFSDLLKEYKTLSTDLSHGEKVIFSNKIISAAEGILSSRGVKFERGEFKDGLIVLEIVPDEATHLGNTALQQRQELGLGVFFSPFFTLMNRAAAAFVLINNPQGDTKIPLIFLGEKMLLKENWGFEENIEYEHELGHARFYEKRTKGEASIFHGDASAPLNKNFETPSGNRYFLDSNSSSYSKEMSFEEVSLHYTDLIKIIRELKSRIDNQNLEGAKQLINYLTGKIASTSDVLTRGLDIALYFEKNYDSVYTEIKAVDFVGVAGIEIRTNTYKPDRSYRLTVPNLMPHLEASSRSQLETLVSAWLNQIITNVEDKKSALNQVLPDLISVTQLGVTDQNSSLISQSLAAIVNRLSSHDD